MDGSRLSLSRTLVSSLSLRLDGWSRHLAPRACPQVDSDALLRAVRRAIALTEAERTAMRKAALAHAEECARTFVHRMHNIIYRQMPIRAQLLQLASLHLAAARRKDM